MKKLVALFLCSVASYAGFAQGFYLRAGLGYAFPNAGQSIDANGNPYNGTYSGSTGSYSIKGSSFSSGLQSTIGLGYMFSRNIGVQLDVIAAAAPKKYSFSATHIAFSAATTGDVTWEMQAKSPVFAIPSMVLQTGGDVWNIYSRFGIALPLSTTIIMDEIQMYNLGTGSGTRVVDDFTFTIKNSFGIGFAAAAGVQYKINERTSLWGEVSMLSMSVYIKQKQLTAVTENGVSYPTSAVSGNQVVNYSKNPPADSTGANMPAYTHPFSNVGISFGVRISMFGNSKNPSRPMEGKRSERPKSAKFK